MQWREDGYAQASDDTSGDSQNIPESNGIPSSKPDAQPSRYREIDCDVRKLVCGDLSIITPFPVTIRGRDASGAQFQELSVVDRLGSRGACTHIQRSVAPGARLFVLVQLSIEPSTRSTPWVAAQALVERVDQLADGGWSVALAFTRHRFIYGA